MLTLRSIKNLITQQSMLYHYSRNCSGETAPITSVYSSFHRPKTANNTVQHTQQKIFIPIHPYCHLNLRSVMTNSYKILAENLRGKDDHR